MDIPILGADAEVKCVVDLVHLFQTEWTWWVVEVIVIAIVDADQTETVNVNALLLLQKSLSATQKLLRVCTVFFLDSFMF